MINPRQGFQHTSNVSATLIECQKKKTTLYGMWRFVQPLSLPHLNAKTLVKTVSPGVKGEDTERGEPLSRLTMLSQRTAVGEATCMSWAGDMGPPEEACTVHTHIKAMSCEEPEMEPNKSQRETAELQKAQRLAVFARFLKEGKVRKKTTLMVRGFHKE